MMEDIKPNLLSIFTSTYILENDPDGGHLRSPWEALMAPNVTMRLNLVISRAPLVLKGLRIQSQCSS